MQGWVVLLASFAYIGILFAVAYFGDRNAAVERSTHARPLIYALSLAIYCTTWTLFGSVGFAASSGYSFLAIYIGPILLFTVGFPVLRKVGSIAKSQRITSVADFISARYGKSTVVGSVATLIAVVGTVPYIALQLKAISASVSALISPTELQASQVITPVTDVSFVIAILLAVFAILFGTRHTDATESQHGMMLAIAMESIVKLFAIIGVGIFTVYFMFDGFTDLFQKAARANLLNRFSSSEFNLPNFAILTLLSLMVFMLLPRQFHVMVVEHNSRRELNLARWLFPLYLICINLFVIPIALAGLLHFGNTISGDFFVLALPISEHATLTSLLAVIGGLSAGTAMVIVASVALAIMVSNQIILPLLLKRRHHAGRPLPTHMEQIIIHIRRTAISIIILAAYLYVLAADNAAALVSIGLISFAAIAQLAPAFFIGLFWRHANARGAIMGMITGFAVWAYTLLLPTLLPPDHAILSEGLLEWSVLRPHHLLDLQLSPIANGVLFSLLFNVTGVVLGSLSRSPSGLEALQASAYVAASSHVLPARSRVKAQVTVEDLIDCVGQYLGAERTKRTFNAYAQALPGQLDVKAMANNDILQFSEQLLASAVGNSSSRLIHSLLLERGSQSDIPAISLLDDASQALRYNHEVLQTAIDQIEQGICVFDSDYRLSSWNTRFRNILNLPKKLGTVGTLLSDIVRELVQRNRLDTIGLNDTRFAQKLLETKTAWQLELPRENKTLEVRGAEMPQGGYVFTWHDITDRVLMGRALSEANESLEKRVSERTSELTLLNAELEKATLAADKANNSKTRFLAAAGHDIVQPLNAARLYSAALQEKLSSGPARELAHSINQSLNSVEEILGAILAISRLDADTHSVKLTPVELGPIFDQLSVEFKPMAEKKGLKLIFVQSSATIMSEPSLLKRLLQNLVSNAIKYTQSGKVLVGARNRDGGIYVEVLDTGIGVPPGQREAIFNEFTRLQDGIKNAPGLGLGLSIVRRISKRLGHDIQFVSRHRQGTRFYVELGSKVAAPLPKNEKTVARQVHYHYTSGVNVLCIDNDMEILRGMRILLEQWGCQVKTATSPAALKNVDTISEFIPDILLLDYHLDEETGLEAAQTIHKLYDTEFPCVLITADRSPELKNKAELAGFTLLNKPVKPAALRSVFSRIRKRAAAE